MARSLRSALAFGALSLGVLETHSEGYMLDVVAVDVHFGIGKN